MTAVCVCKTFLDCDAALFHVRLAKGQGTRLLDAIVVAIDRGRKEGTILVVRLSIRLCSFVCIYCRSEM